MALWDTTIEEDLQQSKKAVEDFVGPKQPVEEPTEVSPWSMISYRYSRGLQNTLLNNLKDVFKIKTAGEGEGVERAAIHAQRERELREQFPEEHRAAQAGETGGIAGGVAEFAGMLEDPTTVISGGVGGAIGRRVGLGAATGVGAEFAGLAAIDNLSYQYVESPTINKKQLAIATVLGGAVPGLITKLGERGAHRVVKDSESPGDIHGAAKRQGVELTPEEIRKADDIIQGSDEGFKLARERAGSWSPGSKQLDEMVAKFEDQPLNSFSNRVALKQGYNPVGDAWETATPKTRAVIKEASRTQKQHPTQGLKPPKPTEQAKQIVKDLEESLTRRNEIATLERKIETEVSLDVQQYQKISDYDRKMDKLLNDIDKVRKKENEALTKKDLQRSAAKQRISKLAAKYKREDGNRIVTKEELRQGTTQRRTQEPQRKQQVPGTPARTAPDLTPQEVSKSLFAPEEIKNKIANTYKRLAEGQSNRRVYLEDLRKELPDIPKKDLDESLLNIQAEDKGVLYPLDSPLERTEGRVNAALTTAGADRHIVYLDTTKFPMDKQNAYKKAKTDIKEQRKFHAQNIKESGEIDPRLMQTVAGAGVGGTAGLLMGEDPGDGVLGAILGGALPWVAGKAVGKWREKFRNPTPENIGEQVAKYTEDLDLIERVPKKLGKLGPAGQQLAKGMEKAYNMSLLATADGLTNIGMSAGKTLSGKQRILTTAEKELIPLIIEEKTPQLREKLSSMGLREVPAHVNSVARQTRKETNRIADRAVEVGIWESKGKKIKNYFPRYTDEGKLASEEGRQQFIERFQSIGWNEASLRSTLTALTGDDKKFINRFMEHTKKSGEKVIVDKGWIKELLRHRSNSPVSRSAHLEMQRKLDLGEYDYLMDEFRIRDFDQVMQMYLKEANTRIEFAKVFGRDDELAEQLMKQIGDDVQDVRAQDFAANAYYTTVGDATKSKLLKQYYNMPEWFRGAQGRINAFETWSLIMGQMLNPTQTFVNAPTLMSRQTGMFNSIRHTTKGLIQAWKNDPVHREFADRAAAGLEAQLIADVSAGAREHTVFGRGAFVDKYVSKLNSPTEFLKATGFMATESFNQRWATLVGKSYIEELLERNAEIAAGRITDPKTIQRVHNGLAEMGIDYNKSPNELAIKDLHEATMMFNRAVNFTDGHRQTPLAFRSPYGKLFTMFKSFAFRQGAFLNDYVIPEIKRGNIKPAATYLTAMGVAGMSIDELRRMVRGDDKDYTFTERYLRAATTAGGFGLMMDTVFSSMGNEYKTLKGLIGPGPGDAFSLMGGAGKSMKESWKEGELNIKPLSQAAYSTMPSLPMQQEIKEMLFEETKNKKKESDMWDLPLELKMELDLDI